MCLSEDYLLPVAQLRAKYGVQGLKPEEAELFRNKVKMKQKLDEHHVRVPRFFQASDLIDNSDIEKSYQRITSMVGDIFVIKPLADFGSNGVSVIHSKEQFFEA